MPKVVLQNGNQYRITIPLALVRALDIKPGDELLFRINNRGNMELSRFHV